MKTFKTPSKCSRALSVGDLIKMVQSPSRGRIAIITDLSMENFFEYRSYVRIAYVDLIGGYEWVQPPSFIRLSQIP